MLTPPLPEPANSPYIPRDRLVPSPSTNIATDTTMSGPQPPRHGNPGSTTEPGERQRVTFGPSPPDQHPPPSVASTGPAARCGGIPDPIRPTLPGHRDRAYLGVMTAQSYPRHEGVPGCAGTGKPADRRCRIRSALPGRPADRTCSARTALPGKPADRPCSARSPLRWAIQGRG